VHLLPPAVQCQRQHAFKGEIKKLAAVL
jgi:hypothetical protein